MPKSKNTKPTRPSKSKPAPGPSRVSNTKASKKQATKTEKMLAKQQKKQDSSTAKKTNRPIDSKLPIADNFKDVFRLKDGMYMDIVMIISKDLENASEEDVNRDMWSLTNLFKVYTEDLKLISLNFPTNTKTQQAYFEHKITHCMHPLLKPILEEKYEELLDYERTTICREHYLMYWGKTYDDLIRNRNIIISAVGRGLCSKIPLSKKIQIMFSMNNMASSVFYDETAADYIEPQNKSELVDKYGYNPYLIKSIQPMGGVELNHSDFVRNGNGYETCLYIYRYPKNVDRHWLATVTNNAATISTIDIETINNYTVKKDLRNSIAEYKGRVAMAKNTIDAMEADEKQSELSQLAYKIQEGGEIMKRITTRIYLAADTYETLMKAAQFIMRDVCEAKDWLSTINLNEMEYEWTAKFKSASMQKRDRFSKRNGKPVPASTLGGGDPFHYTSLNDPYGSNLGYTLSNGRDGRVLFDLFCSNDVRTSYNFIAAGVMGKGKSTLLKKLLRDRAARGDYVRVIDVTGEFSDIAMNVGGKVVYLDGNGGLLNLLQINKVGENNVESYTSHISNVVTIYKFLAPESSQVEQLIFEEMLRRLYEKYGMTPEQFTQSGLNVTELGNKDYPILEEILPIIDTAEQYETNADTINYLRNIKQVISSLVRNFGNIFNGHTSIDNLIDTQVVVYNISELAAKKQEIFDAQLFNALSLCWANAVKVGSRMKALYEHGEIDFLDIKHFMLLIDESHKTINALKPYAVNQVLVYAREGRKYFAGIGLASQSIRDYVPNGVSGEAADKIKRLFELCQYKFIMMQDSNSLKIIKEIFSEQFTAAEISMIPRLERGQCILAINGYKNVTMQVEVTQEELSVFKGGV